MVLWLVKKMNSNMKRNVEGYPRYVVLFAVALVDECIGFLFVS